MEGLVEPRDDDVAGLSQRLRWVRLVFIPRAVVLLIGLACEGVRRSCDLQRRQRRTTTLQQGAP
jgi:hypothetical protein